MKFAVIAAGEGSRLAREGIKRHKPLVRLNGEPMLDRLIRIFIAQGASEIVLIVNEHMRDVVEYARKMEYEFRNSPCRLRLVVKTTPGSMYSFFEISCYLEKQPFCLTTVDTVFRELDFADYISAFSTSEADGLMAVTDYVDDEKPLYVATDADMNITGFYDEDSDCRYISGGVYCLKPETIDVLRNSIESGQNRMRDFQRQLIKDGLHLKAYRFPKIIDVDHAGDIGKAESFLQEN